jgi:hypothetical protein
MRPVWRPGFRVVLAGVMVLSLAWSGWSFWQLSRLPVTSWLLERGQTELSAALDKALARYATPQALADLIRAHLAVKPRNWVALDALIDMAPEGGLPVDVTMALAEARAQDFSFVSRSRACAACAYDLRQCSLGPELTCGLGINLTVIGDLLSLTRESTAYATGTKVDEVDVFLSLVGIGATGMAALSGGTSLAVKTGAGLAKTAHRMGRLSDGVIAPYRMALRNSDDLARARALSLTEDLGALQRYAGPASALHLLAHVDNANDARQMARVARALGPRSVGALEVLGKSRLLRIGFRMSDLLRDALAALAAALMALGGLLARGVLAHLRRMARP